MVFKAKFLFFCLFLLEISIETEVFKLFRIENKHQVI